MRVPLWVGVGLAAAITVNIPWISLSAPRLVLVFGGVLIVGTLVTALVIELRERRAEKRDP